MRLKFKGHHVRVRRHDHPDPPAKPNLKGFEWGFYLPDEDCSVGWTNHGYVLQWVCYGIGVEPSDAWEEAVDAGRVPERFDRRALPSVAIRQDHELSVSLP